jgi:hypothetical protein
MKQYTNQEQTAKLIELGFENPKSIVEHDGYWGYDYAYSIGELIEVLSCLPMAMDISSECVVTNNLGRGYVIYTQSKEPIDALFGQIVKLKEEGVI